MHNYTYNQFKNYLTENQYNTIYLTEKQYNKICKYIKVIDAIKDKLFKFIMNEYLWFEYDELKGRLTYYQDEYLDYLDETSIGDQFFDLPDNKLFEFIHRPFL